MRSIERRLLGISLALVVVAGLATGWAGYWRAVHEADELFDAQLAQNAQILAALVHEGDDDEAALPAAELHKYQRKLMFQIWEHDDGETRLLLRSPGAPHAWPAGAGREGFSVAEVDRRPWRFFALADHDRVVLAAHDLHIRDELAGEIALAHLKPYAFGLPLLAVALLVALRSGLAPLRRMAEAVQARAPDHLDPMPEDGAPQELLPLIRAMNRLFERTHETLANERRFTADAAHELRTPIAAIRAQLEVASRTADEVERREAIAKSLRGAGRMTHLVVQLLTLARLEAEQAEPQLSDFDLSELVGELASGFAGEAKTRRLEFGCRIEPGIRLHGSPELIRVLARNLIDNALRYTCAGGRVEVSLARDTGHPVLRVADDGPGVAPEERNRLGRRFSRLDPHAAEGAGLGLSIVTRIAELHGAHLHFGEGLDARGLGARVDFATGD